MELLAFVHTAVNYEDPNPDPEVTLLDGKSLKIPSSAGVALAGVAMAMAAVSASPDQAMAATSSIGAGSSGEEVTHIQEALGIEADGQFGAKTQAAVMDFQIRQGLKEVDGIVGKETATALGLDEKYKPVYYGVVDTYSGIGLNIRRGPGLNYRRIGGLEDGTLVEIVDTEYSYYDSYEWGYTSSGDWVATDYVTPVGYHEDVWYPCEEEVYYHEPDWYPCEEEVYYHEPEWYPCEEEIVYDPCEVSGDCGYGGYVNTRSNIGLNIRSGPGLDYPVVDGAGEGAYLPDCDGVVDRYGYEWKQQEDGNWYASNYVH
ncbi:MAG: peptidoglycan-binding protein [Leptolyngbyaceae cyanobacterium bins.302]|nr:peptidoglycan-binding protein [Leptolyngbyaceae cyanobacterium bins.302]